MMLRLYSVLEINIGIICGAMISLRPLFAMYRSSFKELGTRVGTLSKWPFVSRSIGTVFLKTGNTRAEKSANLDGTRNTPIRIPGFPKLVCVDGLTTLKGSSEESIIDWTPPNQMQ